MPLLRLQVSVEVPAKTLEALVLAASKLVAGHLGKPEAYMMVTLDEAAICMAGKTGPAAAADLRGIGGFGKPVNEKIAKDLCALLKDQLGIDPARVYINFTDVAPHMWGWKGATFG